jgi:hypothetical protein
MPRASRRRYVAAHNPAQTINSYLRNEHLENKAFNAYMAAKGGTVESQALQQQWLQERRYKLGWESRPLPPVDEPLRHIHGRLPLYHAIRSLILEGGSQQYACLAFKGQAKRHAIIECYNTIKERLRKKPVNSSRHSSSGPSVSSQAGSSGR